MTHDTTRDAVLIFRTVSIEKLDGVLTACRGHWPDRPLAVLSNVARRDELMADPRVAEVVVVEPRQDGYASHLRLDRRFVAIVVPVGNRHGTGYANVLRAAANCRADSYHLAPYATGLRPVSRTSLRWLALAERLLLALCLPLGWIVAQGRFRR